MTGQGDHKPPLSIAKWAVLRGVPMVALILMSVAISMPGLIGVWPLLLLSAAVFASIATILFKLGGSR